MKISVVTAVYNREATIADAIQSVASQTCCDLEYVVIDGMSSDGTSDVVDAHENSIHVSIREPDSGIYDALNKGIKASSGDVVGFLHADDLFADDSVVERVREKFQSGNYDAVYGDLTYVGFEDPNQIIRYWKSGDYSRRRFWYGWMPPHPTVYRAPGNLRKIRQLPNRSRVSCGLRVHDSIDGTTRNSCWLRSASCGQDACRR